MCSQQLVFGGSRWLLSALSPQPLARWWRLMPKDAAKMPESAWKLVFYTMSWSYSTYLLFFTSYSFFHDPPSVFYSKTHTHTHTPTINGAYRKLVHVLRIAPASDYETAFHWCNKDGCRCRAESDTLPLTRLQRGGSC